MSQTSFLSSWYPENLETGAGFKHTFLLHLQRNETIIHVDLAAHFHHLANVLVVQPQGVLVTLLHVGIIQSDLESGPSLQLHLRGAALQTGEQATSPNLRDQALLAGKGTLSSREQRSNRK